MLLKSVAKHKESMMCAHVHTLNTLLQIAIPYLKIQFKPRAENILCGVHCVSIREKLRVKSAVRKATVFRK